MLASVLALLKILLLNAVCCRAAQENITYRWVYRNPLSLVTAFAGDDDPGMGSYFGSRNSLYGFVEDVPQLALTYNHGATFAVLPNGSLATIWQASIQWWEGSIGQSAFWSLSDDDGDTWGPPIEIFSNKSKGGGPIWGPQIHVHENTLFMFFSGTAPAACESNAGPGGGTMWPPGGSLMVTQSFDNGDTWGEPQIIFSSDADGGIAKLNIGRVTVTASGNWLLPFWREASGPAAGTCWGNSGLFWHGIPGVFQSSDQGQTWQETVHLIKTAAKGPRSKWLIENTIAAYRDSRTGASGLLQLFRDDTGTAWQSHSLNGGRNWTDALPGSLPSPDSKTDIWPLPGGGIVAAFNNVTNTLRQNLSLATSGDGGETWQPLALIEGNTTYAPFTGAFSYPTVLYLPRSNRILVAYSVGYPKSSRTALLSNAEIVAPGVYEPLNDQQTQAFPPGVQNRHRRDSSPAGAPGGQRPRRGTKSGFRRRLTAGDHSRGLRQLPYQYGAWGFISYGIRLAYLDATNALLATSGDQSTAPAQAQG